MPSVIDKLNLKAETAIEVVNAPASFEPALAALRGVAVARRLTGSAGTAFALVFATTRREVEAAAKAVAKGRGDLKLWIAYPKQSSKRYTCEFNRDTGWAALGKAGFEPVRQIAIDEDWSALRFRRVGFIRKMTRSALGALTAEGKRRTSAAKRR